MLLGYNEGLEIYFSYIRGSIVEEYKNEIFILNYLLSKIEFFLSNIRIAFLTSVFRTV